MLNLRFDKNELFVFSYTVDESAWSLIDALILTPALHFQVEFLAHADQDEEYGGHQGSKRAICADCRYRLHDRVEGVKTHYHILVLQKQHHWKESPRRVVSRFDLVSRCHPLALTWMELRIFGQVCVQSWHDSQLERLVQAVPPL